MLPLSGLDDELAALREEVARLHAENARLLRLLELSPREARPPGPVQTGIFDATAGPVHAGSPAAAKVAFYRALFAARRTHTPCAGRTPARAGRAGRRLSAAAGARACRPRSGSTCR